MGARPLSSAIAVGAMPWLPRTTEHSMFVGGMLGLELLVGAGLGPLFMLIFLVGEAIPGEQDIGARMEILRVTRR